MISNPGAASNDGSVLVLMQSLSTILPLGSSPPPPPIQNFITFSLPSSHSIICCFVGWFPPWRLPIGTVALIGSAWKADYSALLPLLSTSINLMRLSAEYLALYSWLIAALIGDGANTRKHTCIFYTLACARTYARTHAHLPHGRVRIYLTAPATVGSSGVLKQNSVQHRTHLPPFVAV
jgi:hypothetical protein